MMKDIDTLESQSAAILELGRRFNSGEITRARRDQRLLELRFASMRRARSREFRITPPPPVTFYFIEAVTPTPAERSVHHV
ncbi:MAG TPA: hypothetical protein VEQ40_08460 [Pyrinomonadaceae bacterium]|nr:hypothetical protein [Pyrinomonadaceae bacterium]